MKAPLHYFIAGRARANRQRRRSVRLISVLSLFVALGVFWQLRIVGITISDEACCGKTEHTHTEECKPVQTLVCGFDDITESTLAAEAAPCPLEEHTHGDSCREIRHVTICTQEEHIHTDACYDWIQVPVCTEEHEHEAACFESQRGELLCTVPEHTHTEECSEDQEVLICTTPEHTHGESCAVPAVPESPEASEPVEGSHVHTEECCQTTWSCGFDEEHVHILACYSDPSDVETSDIWEADLPALTGNWSQDLAAVARSQLNYEQSSRNFLVAEDGETLRYYSRYGAFYGTPYSGWNATFGAFCLHYAGIPEALPRNSGVFAWAAALQELELLANTQDYLPQIGDLIFCDEDGNGSADRMGILTDTQPGGGLIVIEGDVNGTVAEVSRHINDWQIMGCVPVGLLQEMQPLSTEVTDIVGLQTSLAVDDVTNDPIIVKADLEINTGIGLDLNGHTVQFDNGKGFVIKDGGSLNISDSVEAIDEWNAASDINYNGNSAQSAGMLASFNSDSGLLTYYQTNTRVLDPSVGRTIESLATHPVTLSGRIKGGTITVESGGTFTLQSGSITDYTGSAINAVGGTVNLNGGYICGGKNAVHAEQGASVNLSQSVLAANTASAIELYGGSTLEMTGGVIAGNSAEPRDLNFVDWDNKSWDLIVGAGIFCQSSTVNMSGGYITNNHIGEVEGCPYGPLGDGYSGGSGIYLKGPGAQLTLSGEARITSNYGPGGGGIHTFNHVGESTNVTMTMTGGYVSGNYAYRGEGGGINLRAATVATISGGYITNNMTATHADWGGGGVFCSEQAELTLKNVLITENHAGGFGGGVAGCSTGDVMIGESDGAAIFNNTADGLEDHLTHSNKNDDKAAFAAKDTFMKQNADGNYRFNDYYCALNSSVTNAMLGGGLAQWHGCADWQLVESDYFDPIGTASKVMGLNANPSTEDRDNAYEKAVLYFYGNTSYTHGGGVLSNGVLNLGSDNDKPEEPISLTIKAQKALNSEYGSGKLADYSFGFRLLDENKEEISTVYNDNDGLITFPKITYNVPEESTEPITYTYYLEELLPDYPSIVKDDSLYKLEVTLSKVENKYSPTKYKLTACLSDEEKVLVSNGTVTDSSDDFLIDLFSVQTDTGWYGWSDMWIAWAIEHGIGEWSGKINYLFNNTFADKVGIEVHKEWKDANGNTTTDHPESIDVYLTRNGERYKCESGTEKSPVTLDASCNWSYKWSKLSGYEGDTKFIWGIEEIVPDGWESHLSYSKLDPDPTEPTDPDPTEPEEPSGPQPVTDPEPGKSYYAGNLEKSLLLVVDGDMTYFLPPWNDTHLPNAKYEIEGSGNQFYLKQANSYLCHNAQRNWDDTFQYYYLSKSQSQKTLFSVDNASRLYSVVDGITYYISTDVNTGPVRFTTDPSSVMILYTIPETTDPDPDPPDPPDPGGGSNDSLVTITNTKKSNTYGFSILKQDEDDTGKPLPGAVFNLLLDGVPLNFTGGDGTYVYTTDAEKGKPELVTGSDGFLHVSGLPAGTYSLEETIPPEGYSPDNLPKIPITLGDSVTLVDSITVPNTPMKFELPETGGGGYFVSTAMGLTMMVFAAGWLILRRKERRARG